MKYYILVKIRKCSVGYVTSFPDKYGCGICLNKTPLIFNLIEARTFIKCCKRDIAFQILSIEHENYSII